MWDKNSVGCCTDNLELAHSWHDTGCIGRCTWENPNTLEVVAKRAVPFNPSVIYALSDSPGIRNQFNFECPTHHPAIGFKMITDGPWNSCFKPEIRSWWSVWDFEPEKVPTVAILLGLFIPITIILCAIVGFIHFVGRCTAPKPKTDEEEPA